MKNYKVIIIGAGPSGLATANYLLENGIDDILVIERNTFPRYKCCAGYITNKTKKIYEKMGLKIEDCHYNLIKDFNIFYRLKKRQNINNKFLYTNKNIDRVELDNAFFELSKSKKIEILENSMIKSHDINRNEIILTSGEKFHYEYLIFADGTLGYGSKYQKIKSKNIALQLVFPYEKEEEIQIHFGITKKGYAWVSSYQGMMNVGITDVYDLKNNYNEIMKKFLEQLHIKQNLENLKGAFTPIGIRKPIIHKNIYYVGDAVGACDPLTLSGLRYALTTGENCAKAIALNKPKIYEKHIRLLKIKFFFMKILLKIFYLKFILFLVFNIGCKYFGIVISYVFNHFFINKK